MQKLKTIPNLIKEIQAGLLNCVDGSVLEEILQDLREVQTTLDLITGKLN